MTPEQQQRLRALPAVDEVLSSPFMEPLRERHSRAQLAQAVREALDGLRALIKAGEAPVEVEAAVSEVLSRARQRRLQPVINATGVVLHTNLGRAPLPRAALERLLEVGQGYCNVELALEEGQRGVRGAYARQLASELTGAEQALFVNNCAAGLLLSLSALASGKEIVISRGELVEIGGGFRLPDVMKQAGVKLVEVGTTNRTRVDDYESAITEETALLLKLHRSNFAMVGYTAEVSLEQLAELGRRRGLMTMYDLGSGALAPLKVDPREPWPGQAIDAGVDLVAFSGDKLLGGPQAGVLVGKQEAIERLERHPLLRALRVDKLTLAALEATLELYRDGGADEEVPARALMLRPLAQLEAAAARVVGDLGAGWELVACDSKVGGGSLPLTVLPSFAARFRGGDAEALERALRRQATPVMARVADGALWLDLRCVSEAELPMLVVSVRLALKDVVHSRENVAHQ